MRASKYFMATLRQVPAEAQNASHRLMLRAGMIQRITSGIYAWLPLGLRVLQRIEAIVREEQNRAGALEVLAPTLQPAQLWKNSGRYEDYGKELLRLRDRHDAELLYGPTAEEVFTLLFRTHIHSYAQLPVSLYNIQWKFRDEIRPRFGVMRGREFLMKDTYSFDLTPAGARESYKNMFSAYMKTFKRMDLKAIPVQADSGPIGGDLSHEFQILADTGESALYYDEALDAVTGCDWEDYQGLYAAADEKHCANTCTVAPEALVTGRGIEVGHIFYFGTKYSQPLGAMVLNPQGQKVPVEMGSYGIGVSRLVGAIIESHHDEAGIMWPESVAPYKYAVAALGNQEFCHQGAQDLYNELRAVTCEDVFFYDLKSSPGEVFADLDLIGFPYQIIFGNRWQNTQEVEVKVRRSGERFFLSVPQLISHIKECESMQGGGPFKTLHGLLATTGPSITLS